MSQPELPQQKTVDVRQLVVALAGGAAYAVAGLRIQAQQHGFAAAGGGLQAGGGLGAVAALSGGVGGGDRECPDRAVPPA